MKRKKISIVILMLLISINLYSYNTFNSLFTPGIYNPFNRYNKIYGSNHLNFHHTFLFTASSFSYGSFYKGIYLNSLEYNINNKMTSYIHLGEEMGYYNINTFSFNKKNFLYGATFYYHPSKNFSLKIEYGATPSNVNSFNYYGGNCSISSSMSVIINNLINKNSSLTINVNYKSYK